MLAQLFVVLPSRYIELILVVVVPRLEAIIHVHVFLCAGIASGHCRLIYDGSTNAISV